MIHFEHVRTLYEKSQSPSTLAQQHERKDTRKRKLNDIDLPTGMSHPTSDAGIVQLMSAPDGTVYFVTFEMRQPQNQQQMYSMNSQAMGQATAGGAPPLLVPISAVPMDPTISATLINAFPQGSALQTVAAPALMGTGMMQPSTSSGTSSSTATSLIPGLFYPNNTNQSVSGQQSAPQQPQQEQAFTSTNKYQVDSSTSRGRQSGSASANSDMYDHADQQQQELSADNDGARTIGSLINHAQHSQSQYSSIAPTLNFPTANLQSRQPSSQFASAAATLPTNWLASGLGSQRSITVYTDIHDEIHLSNYQCLLRKQVEFFEAGAIDIGGSKQGRNRPIELGQLGIRCRHCAMIPPKLRTAAAFYFPSKLSGIYQASQHIALGHLLPGKCQNVDPSIRKELYRLKQNKSSPGSGREYWAKSAREKGVVETEGTLRLLPMSTMMATSSTST